MKVTVTIPDDGVKVLDSWLGEDQIEIWVQHAVDNKLRQRTDACILEETDKNPQKMTMTDKLNALKDVTLPTKANRNHG